MPLISSLSNLNFPSPPQINSFRMSTGPQRLFRCRVRDLASCFYACRLPLEEDQADKSCSKSPKMSGGSIVLEFGNGSRKMSTANKIRGEKILETSLSSSSSHREPRFAEEEYIVFCFREDGEIDLVNENEGTPSEERNGTTCAVTSRKKDTQNSEECDKKWEKDQENETVRVDPDPDEEKNESKMECWESSDSNRSDTTSTGSFAFPVLGIEWIGSPVHMPKSEKQSVSCCRF